MPIFCKKLKNRNTDQISSFLIRKFNEVKVKQTAEEFKEWGFTARTLTNDVNNLFQFLVLVSYDRRPFDRPDYKTVWEKDDTESVYYVLEREGLLNLSKVSELSKEELDNKLRQCQVKRGLHLHSVQRSGIGGTKFAKTIKEIASKIDQIMQCLRNMNSGLDVMRLHQLIDDIHGFGRTLAAKFVMYTVRIMGIGNVLFSELDLIAKNLRGEWHNSKWSKKLEEMGLLEEVEEKLRDDPFAFDYFWDLDKYYCSQGRCEVCDL